MANKKITDLTVVSSLDELTDDDLMIVEQSTGTKASILSLLKQYFLKGVSLDVDLKDIIPDGAGAHNAIYRGKYLGSAITDEQSANIKAGTFTDLFIGDYWTINSVNYRIAAFDYYLHAGDTECTTHHAVIVPDTCLYNAVMNSSNTTSGGYAGSSMYTSGLASAKSTIKAAFGSHVLSHRVYVTNAVSNGNPSGGAWVDEECNLMNEQMVYGGSIFMPTAYGGTVPSNYRVEKSQLPLFALDHNRIMANRTAYWLRDVVSGAHFPRVYADGNASYAGASDSHGVRPAFCIS